MVIFTRASSILFFLRGSKTPLLLAKFNMEDCLLDFLFWSSSFTACKTFTSSLSLCLVTMCWTMALMLPQEVFNVFWQDLHLTPPPHPDYIKHIWGGILIHWWIKLIHLSCFVLSVRDIAIKYAGLNNLAQTVSVVNRWLVVEGERLSIILAKGLHFTC